jgi:hypothetical protein
MNSVVYNDLNLNSLVDSVLNSFEFTKTEYATHYIRTLYPYMRKRNIGNLEHYKYVNEIDLPSKEYDFLNIDPSTPAELIIKNARLLFLFLSHRSLCLESI